MQGFLAMNFIFWHRGVCLYWYKSARLHAKVHLTETPSTEEAVSVSWLREFPFPPRSFASLEDDAPMRAGGDKIPKKPTQKCKSHRKFQWFFCFIWFFIRFSLPKEAQRKAHKRNAQRRVSPVATGAERRCLSTLQAFWKKLDQKLSYLTNSFYVI